MIGLVLVSHSAALAEGVRDLAQQMTHGRVPIAIAGGVDDADHPIGTDPMKVFAAITSVYSEDGVVVLMDLGSALMSAETALDLMEPSWKAHVHLCDAPFVEGAISAAIQASIGSSAEVVIAEARASLTTKERYLASTSPLVESDESLRVASNADAHRLRVIVPNALGIHARPAAKLVSLVGEYAAAVMIHKGTQHASARSINQVALLDARYGDSLDFVAEGDDAAQVLRAIQALVDDHFGDRDNGSAPLTATPNAQPDDVLIGVGASTGLAIGQVYLLDELPPPLATVSEDVDREQRRFVEAVTAALDELDTLIDQSTRRLGAAQAAIFNAHRLMLRDDDLLSQTRQHIAQTHHSADFAWWTVVKATAARYRQAESAILQMRAADVLDVGKRVLDKLTPNVAPPLDLPDTCILVASDLSPSQTAQLDPRQVLGIVTQHGGATSHTAIIARSLGIPAVVGLGAGIAQLTDGQTVIVDAEKGWIYPHPTPAQLDHFRDTLNRRQTAQTRLREESGQPAITPDGRRVEVAGNIGSASNAAGLLDVGAEGVGLFRTEFLFMNRAAAPNEEQQVEAYAAAAAQLGGCPMIIRTLDVGGDKLIDYLNMLPEDNPFLGYRGVRLWLDDADLAHAQLRAICRVSARHPVKVMFPMIGTLDEVLRARQMLRDVQDKLAAESIAFDPTMEVGIMIEVPSVVLIAAQLAPYVDFFSLGTNDLTQYLMAADRGNARVSHLATPFQPALLRAIQQVVESAHAHGKWVGMCGEMAGNPRLTRVLLGLGLDELSMSSPAIPEVKAIIRRTSYADAQHDAAHVLTLPTASDVEHYLSGS